MGRQNLAMSWLIAVQAAASGPLLGSLALFAANFTPPGWHLADGTMVSARDYPDLMGLIGTTFGGQGPFFNLPNLTGRTAIGVGQASGLPPVALAQTVTAPQPALGLGYIICAGGAAPPPSGNGAFPAAASFAGQILAYAAAQPPAGWLVADGSLQSVSACAELFEAIGTTYGGDGQASFALPDLRSRTVLGA